MTSSIFVVSPWLRSHWAFLEASVSLGVYEKRGVREGGGSLNLNFYRNKTLRLGLREVVAGEK